MLRRQGIVTSYDKKSNTEEIYNYRPFYNESKKWNISAILISKQKPKCK